jgi:hypothetical protein
MLCVHHLFWKETPKNRIVVRTIPQKTVAAQPQKVVATSPKLGAIKSKPIATPAKKGKVVAAKGKPVATPALKAQEETPIVKPKSIDLPIPEWKIKTEQPFQEIVQEEVSPSYGETLIAYLQGCLDLPEFGEVKVELEIDRNGHLVHFEILEEKSKKNAEFLKKRLPELVLPCFNNSSNETAAFTITFKNSTRPIL